LVVWGCCDGTLGLELTAAIQVQRVGRYIPSVVRYIQLEGERGGRGERGGGEEERERGGGGGGGGGT
jgi:hypothetical protein